MRPNRLTGKPLAPYQRELIAFLEACRHPENALEGRIVTGRVKYTWCARCGAMRGGSSVEWTWPTYGEDDDA